MPFQLDSTPRSILKELLKVAVHAAQFLRLLKSLGPIKFLYHEIQCKVHIAFCAFDPLKLSVLSYVGRISCYI